MTDKPYIEEAVTEIIRKYNPKYGDDRICKCGHPYYRHFDTYEEMAPVGCKYCRCYIFAEETEEDIEFFKQMEARVHSMLQFYIANEKELDFAVKSVTELYREEYYDDQVQQNVVQS